MKSILLILSLLFSLSANALTIETATVTATNVSGTVNGNTITVNGTLRTWVTTVATANTEIAATNKIGAVITNMFNAYAATPVPNGSMRQSGTNAIIFQSYPGKPMVISLGGLWGTVTFSTNTLADSSIAQGPKSAFGSNGKTNVSSVLVEWISSNESTNIVPVDAPAFVNYVDLTTDQVITGANTYSNANQVWHGGRVTADYPLTILSTTPNTWPSPSLVFSNQHPSGPISIVWSIDIETNWMVYVSKTAWAIANSNGANAFFVANDGTVSIGVGGPLRVDDDTNVVISTQLQIGIGGPTITNNGVEIVVNDNISTPEPTETNHLTTKLYTDLNKHTTNSTWYGTNVIDGSFAERRHEVTGLIAGNNVINSGTNGYINLSGSGNANICAINDCYDGKILTIRNTNTWSMIIVNNSGFVGAVTTNRIFTGTGADVTVTNRPGFVRLRYDSGDGSWNVESRSN